MCFEHPHVLAYYPGMPGPAEFFLLATIVWLLYGESLSEHLGRMREFRRNPRFRKRWFISGSEMEERARDRANAALTFLLILSMLVALIVLALVH